MNFCSGMAWKSGYEIICVLLIVRERKVLHIDFVIGTVIQKLYDNLNISLH